MPCFWSSAGLPKSVCIAPRRTSFYNKLLGRERPHRSISQEPLTTLLEPVLQSKYEHMQVILHELGRVCVAFSAGVDSTLILRVAIDTLGIENVAAVTGRSPSLASSELQEARDLARQLGATHVILDTGELSDNRYAKNPANRCYFCKDILYTKIKEWMHPRGFHAIVNGTNADDQNDWRPGLEAADKHGVRSPAAQAEMSKSDVRQLSKVLRLPNSDKPASPCLSSRVPYGHPITADILHQVEQAEAILKSLGIRECRVRHHENLARIEVSPEWMVQLLCSDVRDRIIQQMRSIGYQYITIDLQGFRSGSLNEVIPLSILSQ